MSAAAPLDSRYVERVYAGVLGKLIGVYLGRPVEGWAYDDIASRFGLVDRYINGDLGVPLIVADDDISGALAFGRAVEDNPGRAVGAREVGRTWLNYIIEDKTILWWGGYGRSTEHTAYLNLRSGIEAPESGSIAVNGQTLAEQIGAQIFSDAFALMHPGDPDAAAALTRAAASVSHDGVALDAAAFFAAMRAQAFVDSDLLGLIDIGRRHVADRRMQLLIDDVTAHVDPADDWRDVRAWVDARYGYARYPGPCHALSNTAMVLAALLLGGDDFGRAVAIASSVGFDTDSNAGTIGCLNGVRLGLGAIPVSLRDPVADRAVVVSADGGEAVTDASREAVRIADAARSLKGLAATGSGPRFDFALPGARHGFTSCPHLADAATALSNSGGALCAEVPAERVAAISTPTFLDPLDRVGNFSTVASPTLYPTQEVTVRLGADSAVDARLYALYEGDDGVLRRYSDTATVTVAQTLAWVVPAVGNLVPFRIGLELHSRGAGALVTIDSVDWDGAPEDFRQTGILLSSIWDTKPAGLAPWVSSARNWEADFAGTYCVSHPGDGGVVTIGSRGWRDYEVTSALILSLHRSAGLVVRARGHRNYTAGVFTHQTVQLIDQIDDERRVLAEVPHEYAPDSPLRVSLSVRGEQLVMSVDGETVITARTTRGEVGGGAGFLVERGTFTADGFSVRRHSPNQMEQRKATA